MKNLNLFKIQQDSIDSKKSSLLLNTAISVIAIAALLVIEAVAADKDEDEDSEADSSE